MIFDPIGWVPHLFRFVLILPVLLGMVGCRISPSVSSETTATSPVLSLSPTWTAPPALPSPLPPTGTASPFPARPAAAQASSPTPLNEDRRQTVQFEVWEPVTALAWSPEGDWLAAGAGDSIYLLDSQSLERRAGVWTGALTQGLAFSPDGRLLAAGGRDGRLHLWELDALLSGESDQQAALWSVNAHRKGANRLAFSPDGALLASGGNDAMIRIWQVSDGEAQTEIIGGTYAISDLAFSPDGAQLAIVNGDVVRLREVESGRISGTLRSETPLFSIAWHSSAGLATGDSSNGVQFWDVEGESLLSAQVAHKGAAGRPAALVWQVVYSPAGRWLASAGGDGVIWLWDGAQKQPLRPFSDHAEAVTSLVFSSDGARLASGSLDRTITVRSLDLPQE